MVSRHGEIIQQALDKRGMTQRQLATEIGVSATRVNDFVNGRAEPSLRIAGQICKALKIPAAIIVGRNTEI